MILDKPSLLLRDPMRATETEAKKAFGFKTSMASLRRPQHY